MGFDIIPSISVPIQYASATLMPGKNAFINHAANENASADAPQSKTPAIAHAPIIAHGTAIFALVAFSPICTEESNAPTCARRQPVESCEVSDAPTDCPERSEEAEDERKAVRPTVH